MPKHLMNFSVYPMDPARYENNWEVVRQFVSDHHLDGIELTIGTDPIPAIPTGLVHTVHFHYSASAAYQNEHFFGKPPAACINGSYATRMGAIIDTVTRLGEHRPFTLPGCAEIRKIVSPSFITHEFLSRTKDELSAKIKTQTHALAMGG